MRRRTARWLTIVCLVSWGAAQGTHSSGSAKSDAVASNLARAAQISAAAAKIHINARPYEVGTASWYGGGFEGKPTASGEPYNMYDLTAAHPTLPLGTFVKVTNLRNHRAVIVRINDRGPVVSGRIIDVSYSAARVLKFHQQGVQRVRLDIVPPKKVPALMAMLQSPALAR